MLENLNWTIGQFNGIKIKQPRLGLVFYQNLLLSHIYLDGSLKQKLVLHIPQVLLNAGYIESLIQATSLNCMQLNDLRTWEIFQRKLKKWIEDLLKLEILIF